MNYNYMLYKLVLYILYVQKLCFKNILKTRVKVIQILNEKSITPVDYYYL